MFTDRIILLASLIIIGLITLWIVPRNKIREAQLIFLFKQLLTWLLGLFVVEYRLIEYPVRLFSYATRTSFAFEYLAYPAICVWFNLYYPENKSKFRKTLHFIIFSSGITIFEAILKNNTELIRYTGWSWYWTWITIFFTFLASRLYYKWFFKEQSKNPPS